MINTRELLSRLRTFESVATIDRVASTNLVARRVMNECIENDLSLPRAVILAGEQSEGRGRNERTWSSPAGKGIYATVLVTRPLAELALVPLAMAGAVASWLHGTFGIDAGIKWPNDVLVGGRKIAGILIEARIQEERALLLIGIGINVEPHDGGDRPNAISLREVTAREFDGVETAAAGFIEHLDERFAGAFDREEVLKEWRSFAVHRPGDPIHCVLADRTVDGTWLAIDSEGRALVNTPGGTMAVSAGDIQMR